MYQYIALGVAIAEVLYVMTAYFRKELSSVFVAILSLTIFGLLYVHFHA